MDDKKALKIARHIREIKEKQKLITYSDISSYIKKNHPTEGAEKHGDLVNSTQRKIHNTHFSAHDMYLKKDGETILIKYKKYLDNILDEGKSSMQNAYIYVAIGVVAILFSLWSNYADKKIESYNTIQKSYEDYGDVHGAWAYMQIFVEQQLKSPKSADFPFGGSRGVTDLGGGRYKVNSYVDSKNAFNATIRTHFNGVIKRKDGGWVLEYLNFED